MAEAEDEASKDDDRRLATRKGGINDDNNSNNSVPLSWEAGFNSTSEHHRDATTTTAGDDVGIGGLGGIVYDVNKLKRNLLQDTVRLYKQELLNLLSDPHTTEDVITLKLSALVQGSAVRTTTDSNLLDNHHHHHYHHSGADGGEVESRSTTESASPWEESVSLWTPKINRKHKNKIGLARPLMMDAERVKTKKKNGLPWTLAYTSKYTRLDDLLQPPPVELRKRRKSSVPTLLSMSSSSSPSPSSSLLLSPSPAAQRRGGKQHLLSTQCLEFHLEGQQSSSSSSPPSSWQQQQYPPMTIHTQRLVGGLLSTQEMYQVCGLTRTHLVLQRERTNWFVLGKRVFSHQHRFQEVVNYPTKNKKKKQQKQKHHHHPRIRMQVVYLDVDLAVLAEAVVDTSLAGTTKAIAATSKESSPTYSVYTKNPAWADTVHRRRRKLNRLLEMTRYWFWTALKKKAPIIDRSHMIWKSPEDEVNRILQELQLDSNSKLKVLKLGNWSWSEDDAWDGKSDPFVHMSADERQEILKKMKIRDVEQAASMQRSRQRRRQSHSWWNSLGSTKRNSFKKPRL